MAVNILSWSNIELGSLITNIRSKRKVECSCRITQSILFEITNIMSVKLDPRPEINYSEQKHLK